MLCSAPELALGPEGPEPAIYILPPGLSSPGEQVAEALGLGPDVVFDLEISPNRSDCFSMVGVARDLAAALGIPFSIPARRTRLPKVSRTRVLRYRMMQANFVGASPAPSSRMSTRRRCPLL